MLENYHLADFSSVANYSWSCCGCYWTSCFPCIRCQEKYLKLAARNQLTWSLSSTAITLSYFLFKFYVFSLSNWFLWCNLEAYLVIYRNNILLFSFELGFKFRMHQIIHPIFVICFKLYLSNLYLWTRRISKRTWGWLSCKWNEFVEATSSPCNCVI